MDLRRSWRRRADRRRAGRRRRACSARRRRPRRRSHVAPRRRHARRRARRHLLLPDAARRQRPRRLDQPGRDQLHRRAARRRARRGLRRGHLLRAVLAGRATARQVHVCVDLACRADGGPSPSTTCRPARTPSPCLGLCERAPAALVIEAGDPPVHAVAGAVARSRSAPGRGRLVAGRRGAPWSPRCRRRGDDRRWCCCAASAASTRSTSTPTGPTAGTRRCAGRSRLGPEGVIAEVTDSGLVGRGGAAFPTGRKWEAVAPPAGAARTTWSATPTSPSPARSRTAC